MLSQVRADDVLFSCDSVEYNFIVLISLLYVIFNEYLYKFFFHVLCVQYVHVNLQMGIVQMGTALLYALMAILGGSESGKLFYFFDSLEFLNKCLNNP